MSGGQKLNLGCGSFPIPGWLNLDVHPAPSVDGCITLVHDLREPLPFTTDSCDAVYSEHFIEHVDDVAAREVLKECFRVLKPGGWLRFSTPDLDKIYSVFREDADGQHALSVIRGLYGASLTPLQAFNRVIMGEALHGLRYSDGSVSHSEGHRHYYNFAGSKQLLEALGFVSVRRADTGQSAVDTLRGLEHRPPRVDLIVEAQKPS